MLNRNLKLLCKLKLNLGNLGQCRNIIAQAQVDFGDRTSVSTASKMYAWQIHGYGDLSELQLNEARVPTLHAPDEVLVRVHATSINPLDVAMIGGYGSCIFNTLRSMEGVGAAEGVEFPLILGRDFSGVVERAGTSAVNHLPPGTRVWGVIPPHWPGSHAQYVTVKAQWASAAPSTMSALEAGGALYAGLTARAGLIAAGLGVDRRGSARGQRVLLLGLGGVGTAALQLLVHAGAEVVVGCADELVAEAQTLGAVAVVPREHSSYEKDLVAAGPYEVILDCAGLGGEEAARHEWRYRRYVTFTSPLLRRTDALGMCAGAGRSMFDWLRQSAAAASSAPVNACPPSHVRWAYFTPSASGIELLTRMAQAGQFRVVVERAWPWTQATAAFERAARGHLRGKLLLDFTATEGPLS